MATSHFGAVISLLDIQSFHRISESSTDRGQEKNSTLSDLNFKPTWFRTNSKAESLWLCTQYFILITFYWSETVFVRKVRLRGKHGSSLRDTRCDRFISIQCLLTTWVPVWVNDLSNLPNYNSAAFPSLPNLNLTVFPNVTLQVNELSFITLIKTDELRFSRLRKAAELRFSRFEVYRIAIHQTNIKNSNTNGDTNWG